MEKGLFRFPHNVLCANSGMSYFECSMKFSSETNKTRKFCFQNSVSKLRQNCNLKCIHSYIVSQNIYAIYIERCRVVFPQEVVNFTKSLWDGGALIALILSADIMVCDFHSRHCLFGFSFFLLYQACCIFAKKSPIFSNNVTLFYLL